MSDSLQRAHALGAFEFPAVGTANGAGHYVLRIEHQPGFDYVNVRGKPDSPDFKSATHRALAFTLPSEPNTLSRTDSVTAFWLGPDEWLLRSSAGAGLFERLSEVLGDSYSACTQQNGGFEQFQLTGPAVPELLCRASTLDFSSLLVLEHGCAQSGFGKAVVLFEFTGSAESVRLIVRRSFAEYLALWLKKVGGEYQAVFA